MNMDQLLSRQNPDGGWPYRQGNSWTEPTAYAVLASIAAGESARAQRGVDWLLAARRPDGGWPPCAGIEESCWVTALVALLPSKRIGENVHRDAIHWLVGVAGEESAWTHRLRWFLSGKTPPADQASPGWPWLPRSAAWVGPTALALLALQRERQHNPVHAIDTRIAQGRNYLLNRMCERGGWNHGAANALGYPADPYPETTGMSLAALRGHRSAGVDRSLTLAQSFLETCRSAEAVNWLRLGLKAHGSLPAGYSTRAEIRFRSVPEIAIHQLISAAGERPDPFEVT